MNTTISKATAALMVLFLLVAGCKKEDQTGNGRIFINYDWQYLAETDTTILDVRFKLDRAGGKEATLLAGCRVSFNNDILAKDQWGFYRKIYTGLVTGDFVFTDEAGNSYTCPLQPLKQFSIPDTFTSVTRGFDNIFTWEGDTTFQGNELDLSIFQSAINGGEAFFLGPDTKTIILTADRLNSFVPGTDNAQATLFWSQYLQMPQAAPAGATLHQVVTSNTKTISVY